MSKGIYLILEPVNHVNAVIKKVNELGYNIIVLSSFPTPSPSQYGYVDECIQSWIQIESWTQINHNLELLKQSLNIEHIKGTYTAVEGVLLFDSIVRKEIGLPRNEEDIIHNILNKHLCRKTLIDHQLSSIKTFNLDNNEFPLKKDFPVYFKPSKGGGSLHVKKCHDIEELNLAYREWKKTDSFHNCSFVNDYMKTESNALAETEARGKLVSVEGYTINGKWSPIGINGRILATNNPAVELALIFPFNTRLESKIYQYIADIHQVLGVQWGPTHTEIMIDGNDLEFIELNLRFAGYDTYELINKTCTSDIGELLVNLGAGKSFKFDNTCNSVALARYYQPPFNKNIYEDVSLPKHPSVIMSYTIWNPDKTYLNPPLPCDYIAGILVKADTVENIVNVINDIDKKVIVDGQSIENDKYNVKNLDNLMLV